MYIRSLMPDEIRRTLLEKLYRNGYIGGRHTAVENLPKGLPSDQKGEAKKVVKQLVREGVNH